jgi:Protein of unknown function (DUF1551).
MKNFKEFVIISFIFLLLSLFVSLPPLASAEPLATESGTAPVLVAAQEAIIPLSANAATGASESPYTLTFKLAGVYLHRENNKSQGLTDIAGSVQIEAGDLDLGWAPGMDTSLMLRNQSYGIELRYLGLHQWDESKRDSAFMLIALLTSSAKFKSALHNAELNLHWWPCTDDRYSFLMGFRWLRLRDRLSVLEGTDILGILGTYEGTSLSCRNDLWGGQVGVEGLLFGKRDQGFSIDGGVKAGIFANQIRNNALEEETFYILAFPPLYDSNSDSWNRTKTAFLSEVVLNANYAFTKNIAMTVGYQFLYVNKVAVPVNDWASTQSVIFHGGRLGLNVAF